MLYLQHVLSAACCICSMLYLQHVVSSSSTLIFILSDLTQPSSHACIRTLT